MEFKLNSKQLEKLLNKIIPAIPTRSPMTILENFLIEIENNLLTIYATDMEISLKSSINVIADGDIKVVVPAKLLHDTVKSLPDTEVKFILNDNGKINLVTDKGQYVITYLTGDQYPDIPSFPTEKLSESDKVVINGSELKKAIDITSFAMSKEEIRQAMMGVLFKFSEDGLRFVATDGHRLVNLLNKKIKTTNKEQYIIPERAISVLSKILDDKDVKILLSQSHISFQLSEIELITRLIGQKYPDYETVIPLDNENKLRLKTKELVDTVKRMLLYAPSSSKKVKFSITKGNVEISAEDIDTGASAKENIQAQLTGDDLDIGFNSTYLYDVISHLTSEEEIIFKLDSPTKAVVVNPVEEKEEYELMMLLMPIRLNN